MKRDREALLKRKALIERILAARRRKNPPPASWRDLARPEQLPPPGFWHIWFIMAGRGFGKTRSGSEWIVDQALAQPKTKWAVVSPTWSDCETVPMAAIIEVLDRLKVEYVYNRSKLRITLGNGATISGYSAEKPDRLRGPNFSGAWCDELAAYKGAKNPKSGEAKGVEYLWHECLIPGVRIGEHPRILVTTTPKPVPLIKELTTRKDGSVVVARGSTFDNSANLSPAVLAELKHRYDGTRRGRQELYGELLLDAEFALWNRDMIDACQAVAPTPQLMRTIVAVDPSGSAEGDATGIITAAIDFSGVIHVLADDTCNGSPQYRYEQVCLAAQRAGAGTIVYEGAYGGDNIAHGIKSTWDSLVLAGRVEGLLPLLKVSPTKTSKADRAHPVVALYEQTEQGLIRIRHARPLSELEDEMVQWEMTSDWSPNRMDALVHAVRFLDPQRQRSTTSSPAMLSLPSLPVM